MGQDKHSPLVSDGGSAPDWTVSRTTSYNCRPAETTGRQKESKIGNQETFTDWVTRLIEKMYNSNREYFNMLFRVKTIFFDSLSDY